MGLEGFEVVSPRLTLRKFPGSITTNGRSITVCLWHADLKGAPWTTSASLYGVYISRRIHSGHLQGQETWSFTFPIDKTSPIAFTLLTPPKPGTFTGLLSLQYFV